MSGKFSLQNIPWDSELSAVVQKVGFSTVTAGVGRDRQFVRKLRLVFLFVSIGLFVRM